MSRTDDHLIDAMNAADRNNLDADNPAHHAIADAYWLAFIECCKRGRADVEMDEDVRTLTDDCDREHGPQPTFRRRNASKSDQR